MSKHGQVSQHNPQKAESGSMQAGTIFFLRDRWVAEILSVKFFFEVLKTSHLNRFRRVRVTRPVSVL